MNNPFVQHIGIWYAKEDELIMMRIMDQISEWCSYCIEKEIHSKYVRSIHLKDGTWIKAILANDNMRGQRCTDSFIVNPEHITEKFIKTVIYPITTIGDGGVFVIDSSDEEGALWDRLWYRMSYRNWYTIYCSDKECK